MFGAAVVVVVDPPVVVEVLEPVVDVEPRSDDVVVLEPVVDVVELEGVELDVEEVGTSVVDVVEVEVVELDGVDVTVKVVVAEAPAPLTPVPLASTGLS